MKGILSLRKLFVQGLHIYGIKAESTTSFRGTLLEKYPSRAVINTINSFIEEKGWVWDGKYAYIMDDYKCHWEVIMYTASGSYRNIGILDNGELESIFFLKNEVPQIGECPQKIDN